VTTILFYNHYWPSLPQPLPDCPSPYQLTFDRDRLSEADLVVFHLPSLREPILIGKRPGQRWVVWSMESDVNCPSLADSTFMQQFDLTMTYRRDASVWTPYFGQKTLTRLSTPPQPKTERAPAVYFASNFADHSGRNTYAAALMQYVKVDSYGRCLRNRTLERDEGRETKLEVIARYRFTLAFENSISQDYVTEKFFEPLLVGSVPVYLGAPNIAEFAPADHCFINVADFRGPAHLAGYLQLLTEHPALYARYLAWKSRALRDGFVQMVERTMVHPLCRLAALRARST
jgi:hypothetical protein